MRGVLGVARESLRRFVALSNPDDEAFLNSVSTQPREWSGFTADLEDLYRGVASEGATGRTALIDTIWLALNRLRSAQNARRAVLIISDGMDNQSLHTRRELLDRAAETDVQIHTVTTYQPLIDARAMSRGITAVSLEQRNGLALMRDLAAKTGGLQYAVSKQGEIEPAIESVSRALRNQYNIGYVPNIADRSGKWRRIQVRVARNGMKAYTRTGYRAN
jgi:Ca-activated chloride channel family protein